MGDETTNSQFVERRSPPPVAEGWHLKKEVPLGIILTVVVQVIAFIFFLANIREDIALIKADQVVLHQRDSQMSQDLQQSVTSLREDIKELNRKMDRILERGAK